MMFHRFFRREVLALGILLAPLSSKAQINIDYLHSFGTTNAVGLQPGQLARGLDGRFYGATVFGITGSDGVSGTLYRLDTNGANPEVVMKFGDLRGSPTTRYRIVASSDGAIYAFLQSSSSVSDSGLVKVQPDGTGFQVLLTAAAAQTTWAHLLEASDGKLYAFAGSKIVRINRDGSGFEVIFTDPAVITISAEGGVSDQLMEGPDGMLYVSHIGGGTDGRGYIYKLNKDGSGQVVILDFGTMPYEMGSSPHQLIHGSDGFLYGVATSLVRDGSFPPFGAPIFRMDTNGAGYAVLANLTNFPVQGPSGLLREGGGASSFFEGSDGLLYGATQDGGANRGGLVFRLAKDGTGFTNLLEFPPSYFFYDAEFNVNRSTGKMLLEGLDGRIHGSTSANAVFRLSTNGSDFETTYSFPDPAAEGRNVLSTLALDGAGTLYGTTRNGAPGDHGTVFKVKTDGTDFTYLHNFAITSDGSEPSGGVLVSDNTLYGTCYSGGGGGFGTVFRLDATGGNYEVLRTFLSTGGDGRSPAAPLIKASDGVLYGTTYFGGGAAAGTIFKLNTNGSGYAIIHRFTNNVSGANPSAALLEGGDGRLYGSAETNGPSGQGVLFAMGKSGAGFILLHNFSSSGAGLRKPQGALVQGSDGALYGTTAAGGSGGFGGVFKLQPDGNGFLGLHEFSATGGDGRAPVAGLTFGADGMLYGVTQFGGGSVNGSIFRMTTNGSGYEKFRAFTGTAGDGGNPIGALTSGPDGTLYGTTSAGGDFAFGTIFRITVAAALPHLAVQSAGPGGFTFLWPQSPPGFQLQSNPDLSNLAGWQPATNTPVPINNDFEVTIAPTGAGSFYRLIKP